MDSTSSKSRTELLALYKELRRTASDYQPSNDKLIELLGGIDAVMESVLNAPNHIMAADDSAALHQYLKEPLSPRSNDTLKWTLDPKNNKLYQISSFVHRHLFSKPVLSI